MKACDCHEDVWKSLSHLRDAWRQEKFAQHMLKETGGKCSKCWRVGRRASSLARGKGASMIKELRHVKSKVFQARLTKLGQEDRDFVMYNFTSVGTK